MNFVIFSYNFLPQDNAESFCTARLASALAESGHSVHVVTESAPKTVSDHVIKQLLSPKVKVTYLDPLPEKKGVWGRIWRAMCFDNWTLCGLRPHVAGLKKVLASVEDPALIARCSPPRSLLIGCACRKNAAKFVAHFSDPYPALSHPGLKWLLINWLSRRALSRVIDRCDRVTVTCEEAKRYFADYYGKVYDRNAWKFLVITHIGEPKLLPADLRLDTRVGSLPMVTHCGFLSTARYAERVGAELASASGNDFVLRLIGDCEHSVRHQLDKHRAPYFVDSCSDPGAVTTINEQSSVALVIDTIFRRGYSPYLPSKFAYLCFSSTPIVVYCQKGSCMHRLSCEFPEAGIFFADVDEKGSLLNAIISALNVGRIADNDRTRLRSQFTREGVVRSLVGAL